MFRKFLIGVCLSAIFIAVGFIAYTVYYRQVREPLLEGFDLIGDMEIKTKMETYYKEHGKFPSNNLEAGLKAASSIKGNAVDAISVNGDSITITYNPKITATGTIILKAIPAKDNPFIWDCTGGTVKAEYRPFACRP
jgi:type IV pilus assembly protein PilA